MLVFFALLSNFQSFRRTKAFDIKPLGKDRITLYEKRFEGLRKMLPANSVVGYISNKQAKDIRFDPSAGRYYLTQYALSPVIVAYSVEHQLVVGNFRGTFPDPESFKGKILILLKDFGNGVMLFRNESK